jgi:hypothetical protein
MKILKGFEPLPGRAHRPARRAGMAHLTGPVPCLGLATSSLGGHDTTRVLNVLGHGPFNKAQAWAVPARHGPNFGTR